MDFLKETYIQYGFAGMCLILLAMLFWIVKALVKLLEANQVVISKNNQVMASLDDHIREDIKLNRSIFNKLLARPCIAKNEDGE